MKRSEEYKRARKELMDFCDELKKQAANDEVIQGAPHLAIRALLSRYRLTQGESQ